MTCQKTDHCTLYSSSQTCATRNEFLVIVSSPVGDPYGRRRLNTWPTLEHGISSNFPPHIQTFHHDNKIYMFKQQIYGPYQPTYIYQNITL